MLVLRIVACTNERARRSGESCAPPSRALHGFSPRRPTPSLLRPRQFFFFFFFHCYEHTSTTYFFFSDGEQLIFLVKKGERTFCSPKRIRCHVAQAVNFWVDDTTAAKTPKSALDGYPKIENLSHACKCGRVRGRLERSF